MTLRLTPETLRACYEFLCTTPPFRGWRMPAGPIMRFGVGKSKREFSWYITDGNKHTAVVSENTVGHTDTLITVMAHEMVHIRQEMLGHKLDHGAEFQKMAATVCRHHGFDPKAF